MAKANISADRSKALEAALAQLDKQFGVGTAMRLGDKPKINVEAFSTGSLLMDVATGIGGFPRGRISEIYAQESVGKTTMTLHAIADCQRKGGTAAFIDAEHALDPRYAKKLGVDVENLILSQPSSGEQALEIAEKLISSGAVDIVVIDSVAALVPQAELDGEMGDQQVGLQARLMSRALRKLTGVISGTNTCVIFINQLRENIATMGYGPKTTTTGGKALKFYASMRISMSRIGKLMAGTDEIGNKIKAKIDKNKFAPPFKVVEFDIVFGDGVSREAQMIAIGKDKGIVQQAGAFYKYEGDQIGQGLKNAIQFLKDNPALGDEIWSKVEAELSDGIGYDDDEDPTTDADEAVKVKEK